MTKTFYFVFGIALSIILAFGVLYVVKMGLTSSIVQFPGLLVFAGFVIIGAAVLGIAKATKNTWLSPQQRFIFIFLLVSCCFGGLTAISLALVPRILGNGSMVIPGLLAVISFIILQVGFLLLVGAAWRQRKFSKNSKP